MADDHRVLWLNPRPISTELNFWSTPYVFPVCCQHPLFWDPGTRWHRWLRETLTVFGESRRPRLTGVKLTMKYRTTLQNSVREFDVIISYSCIGLFLLSDIRSSCDNFLPVARDVYLNQKLDYWIALTERGCCWCIFQTQLKRRGEDDV